MQILIIGKTAAEYALAKKIKQNRPEDIIFVAPGNQAIGDFATCIDIQPDKVKEMVEFAQANEINMTVICDDLAIESGMADAFNEAGLMVFAPEKESARFATTKSVGKRFMYKLNMPTAKFGIFDKETSAKDYVKTAAYPLLIKADKHEAGESVYLCHCEREANTVINKFFTAGNHKIVIETYVHGREVSLYFVTDGYNALPVCPVVPYKYSSEKDGGSITNGVGAYAPAVFADDTLTRKVLEKVIYPALSEIEKNAAPYIGVLGVDLILDDKDNFTVIEFNTFFKSPDCECILELLNTDPINLFTACTVGSLADDYDYVDLLEKSAFSLVLTRTPEHLFDNSMSEITGIDEIEDDGINVTLYNAVNKSGKINAKTGRIASLTATGATLGAAKKRLVQELDYVKFKGKKYRKDILETVYER